MVVETDPKRSPEIILGFTPAEKLEFFLTEYLDEIPDNLIHSTSENKYYKCRKGWFQGVTSVLELLSRDQKIRGEVRELADSFVQSIYTDEFRSKIRVDREDISRANEVIKTVLGALR